MKGYLKNGKWTRFRSDVMVCVGPFGHYHSKPKGLFYFGPKPDLSNQLAEQIGVQAGTWEPVYVSASWTQDEEVLEFVQHLREYCNVRKGRGMKIFMEDGMLTIKIKSVYIIYPHPSKVIATWKKFSTN